MTTFNRVWCRFEGKKRDGTVVKLRIQDLPREQIEDAKDFFLKYFFAGEPITSAVGMLNSPEAIKESRLVLAEMMNDPDHHYVICCEDTDDNSPTIVGLTAMIVKTAEQKPFSTIEIKTKELQTCLKIFYEISGQYDPIKELNISSYLDGRGFVVHPEYRNLGIATRFVKLRRIICKKLNVPATLSWMTAAGTQKATENDNWETVYEVNITEIGKRFGLKFDAPTISKLMLARVDSSKRKAISKY